MGDSYNFEGRTIDTLIDKKIMDALAGLVVTYKVSITNKMGKLAREQEGWIKGFLFGLEMAGEISSEDSEELLSFFLQ